MYVEHSSTTLAVVTLRCKLETLRCKLRTKRQDVIGKSHLAQLSQILELSLYLIRLRREANT